VSGDGNICHVTSDIQGEAIAVVRSMQEVVQLSFATRHSRDGCISACKCPEKQRKIIGVLLAA
jgi:hypothetical protein